MRNTRDMIAEFSRAFGRPVNESWATLTVTERELLGKLLFEETVEYVTKGLGLKICMADYDLGASDGDCVVDRAGTNRLQIELDEGQQLDPVECIDGLADVNVVAHFAAHWHGFNLDLATEMVHDSNMSKLADDGTPIINGVTPDSTGGGPIIDPSKPIGKILKGPNFYEVGPLIRDRLADGVLDNV